MTNIIQNYCSPKIGAIQIKNNIDFGHVSKKLRNSTFLTALGQKVKELRERKGLSQYQLSYQTDMSRSQIQRIENGEVNTSVSSLPVLAEALGVSPKDLLDFE